LLTHHRQDGASDIHRAEEQRLDSMANLFRAEFLKEAGKIAGIVVCDLILRLQPQLRPPHLVDESHRV
jgi:hypothetical protein